VCRQNYANASSCRAISPLRWHDQDRPRSRREDKPSNMQSSHMSYNGRWRVRSHDFTTRSVPHLAEHNIAIHTHGSTKPRSPSRFQPHNTFTSCNNGYFPKSTTPPCFQPTQTSPPPITLPPPPLAPQAPPPPSAPVRPLFLSPSPLSPATTGQAKPPVSPKTSKWTLAISIGRCSDATHICTMGTGWTRSTISTRTKS